MTVDEIIATERDNADFSKRNNHEGSADYHKQIAQWLEELKAYRENSNGYNKEDIELNRNAMYNKALDDFVNACKEDILCHTFGLNTNRIERIAEQLKAGGENE